ncbi:hypothetical protein Peur_034531 [Populus x canadensis]
MRLKSILYAKPDHYSYCAHCNSITFISIDFGSSDSEPYTDENSITWTGDDAYIQSGESQFLKYSTMPYFLTFNLMAIIGPLSTLCTLPFISALELRSLLHGMYSQAAPNYAMLLNLRVAYRANDTISIRQKDTLQQPA